MTPRAQSQELIEHYKAKGLRGTALRCALAKHAKILQAMDPEVAEAIWRRRV